MIPSIRVVAASLRGLGGLALLLGFAVHAFPPAPPHTLFGVVRNDIGDPLDDGATVILETAAGARLSTSVMARVATGANYQLSVPMDAGLTADAYAPTALLPAAPFRLRVQVGRTVFLPIEMKADLARLGLSGGRTRIDLTLGEDADGNGIPDNWEKAVAARLGRKWAPGQINPSERFPGSNMTYLQVYIAGTYAVSPTEGFALRISTDAAGAPRLRFTAVKGRTYTVQAAAGDLRWWTTVPFLVQPVAAGAVAVDAYQSPETREVEIVPPVLPEETAQFYRLLVE